MNFILLGAAGYVAPRHMKAIKNVGGNLLAIYDPFDSVGVIDSYFPNCLYFKDFERLDRHCFKLIKNGINIDYVVITTPNYLHDAHCRWGLRLGSDIICEKPLVLTEENLNNLIDLEKETNKNIYGLYQLRYHPQAYEMKQYTNYSEGHEAKIKYHTPRGNWYRYTWKGYTGKSGGLETNIGCHLFDLCSYMFGYCNNVELFTKNEFSSSGKLEFPTVDVYWDLSIERNNEPIREFKIDDRYFSFNSGFTDLHTHVYKEILAGRGLSIENYRQSIRICEEIRSM